MPRIGLMTAWNDLYAPLAEIAVPIMQRYCDSHGYTLIRGEGWYHDRLENDYATRMSRGDLCKSALFLTYADYYDILMWLDIDSLIMQHSLSIEDAFQGAGLGVPLPEFEPFPHRPVTIFPERDWLWTCNTDGPMSGFWIGRTTPLVKAWVRRFAFATAYEYGGGDQYGMREVAKWPPYDKLVGGANCVWGREAGHCFAPEFGAPQGLEHTILWQPGDWIVTFPGIPLDRRLELMQQYAVQVTP